MPLISEAKPFLPQKININPGKKSAVFVSANRDDKKCFLNTISAYYNDL